MPKFRVARQIITRNDYEVDAATIDHAEAIVEEGFGSLTPISSLTTAMVYNTGQVSASPPASSLTVTLAQQQYMTPIQVADAASAGATIET